MKKAGREIFQPFSFDESLQVKKILLFSEICAIIQTSLMQSGIIFFKLLLELKR
jgi:hypothetical protein